MRIDKIILWVLCGIYVGPVMAGGVEDSVRCRADASQSYALYVPQGCAGKSCPIVYFFDPHGDGGHPLRMYKALADHYGYILVGSNNSRNGNDWAMTDRIWQVLSADTRGRLKIDVRRIYVSGFSGGAKVASYVAMQNPGIRGVTVGGAGLPEGVTPGDFAFSLTMLVGEGDMNMTDLVALNGSLDRTHTNHRLLLFDGIHEWAPAAVMDLAFAGWRLDGIRAGLIPANSVFVDGIAGRMKRRVEGYEGKGELVRADQECRFAEVVLDGLGAAAAWFKARIKGYAVSAEYRRQQQARQALLEAEQARKNELMQQFQQGERYWQGVVADLRVRSKGGGAGAGMNQRLTAFLSLAFYSLSNRCIQANDNVNARHFVTLYAVADAGNPEAWYLAALLDAREGKRAAVDVDLLKAVRCGFRDIGRVSQQPEFRRLTPPLNLSSMQEAIQKKTN